MIILLIVKNINGCESALNNMNFQPLCVSILRLESILTLRLIFVFAETDREGISQAAIRVRI